MTHILDGLIEFFLVAVFVASGLLGAAMIWGL